MANKRIKDLPAVSVPAVGDKIALDGTTTRCITVENLSLYLVNVPLKDQHVTGPGPITIDNDAGVVRVDQATGAAITLTLPLAASKTCDVEIVDWKGDAGTNNITINTTAPDKFPGGFTSWKIAGDCASVFLRRVPGSGYAI
jgi:hypothetical protein